MFICLYIYIYIWHIYIYIYIYIWHVHIYIYISIYVAGMPGGAGGGMPSLGASPPAPAPDAHGLE